MWGRHPCLPCIRPPDPISKKPRDRSRKNKKTYTPFFQALTSTHPRQTNRKSEPRLLQCERKAANKKGEKGEDKKGGDKRCGARLQTCRVAIAGDMSLPASRPPCRPRVRRSVSDKNTQNHTKTSHFVREFDTGTPASSTQTIENKDTIRQHRTPDSQNR